MCCAGFLDDLTCPFLAGDRLAFVNVNFLGQDDSLMVLLSITVVSSIRGGCVRWTAPAAAPASQSSVPLGVLTSSFPRQPFVTVSAFWVNLVS